MTVLACCDVSEPFSISASMRPRSTTAKAASWPLISGSLVGNKSSWFDKFLALLCAGVLVCFVNEVVKSIAHGRNSPAACLAAHIPVDKVADDINVQGTFLKGIEVSLADRIGLLVWDFPLRSHRKESSRNRANIIVNPAQILWAWFFTKIERWISSEILYRSATAIDPVNNHGGATASNKIIDPHVSDSYEAPLNRLRHFNLLLHYLPLVLGYFGLADDPHKKKYRDHRLYPCGKLRNKIEDYLLIGLAIIIGCPGLWTFAWGMVYLQNGISGAGLRILTGISLLLISGILSWLSGCVAVREMKRERKERERND